jgi:hypothetical protein
MQEPKYLYTLFTFLTLVLIVLLFGLYRFISSEPVETFTYQKPPVPSDFQALLEEVDDKESWIYRMYLHQKQNTFAYPRTIYHINLN